MQKFSFQDCPASRFHSEAAKPHRAFTMIELLSVIAITAVLVVIITAAIGNYIEFARQTQLKHTVAVLNESLNEYRTLGGMSKAHSLQGEVGTTRNAQTFTDAVITAMKGGFTCGASLKKFINKTQNIDTTVIGSTGQGANFRFVLNTDTTETTPGDGGESTQDPTIIAGPYGYTSYAGYPTKLWVEVDGTEPFSAQWYFNDGSGYVPLGTDDNSASTIYQDNDKWYCKYDIYETEENNIGDYYVVVSNSVGSATSTECSLSIGADPLIDSLWWEYDGTSSDADTFTILTGKSLALGAGVLSYEGVSVQWYFDDGSGPVALDASKSTQEEMWTDEDGSVLYSCHYDLGTVTTANSGSYYAVVNNSSGGYATSKRMALDVTGGLAISLSIPVDNGACFTRVGSYIYVATHNGEVIKLSEDGSSSSIITSAFPAGGGLVSIAADSAGNVCINNYYYIWIVKPDGTIVEVSKDTIQDSYSVSYEITDQAAAAFSWGNIVCVNDVFWVGFSAYDIWNSGDLAGHIHGTCTISPSGVLSVVNNTTELGWGIPSGNSIYATAYTRVASLGGPSWYDSSFGIFSSDGSYSAIRAPDEGELAQVAKGDGCYYAAVYNIYNASLYTSNDGLYKMTESGGSLLGNITFWMAPRVYIKGYIYSFNSLQSSVLYGTSENGNFKETYLQTPNLTSVDLLVGSDGALWALTSTCVVKIGL